MSVTFAENKPMTEEELKAFGWRVYNLSGTWHAYNNDTKQKFKAGTRIALMKRVTYFLKEGY